MKENEVILRADFSKNYQNKQRHEIQSAYFGYENFTLFTAACYFHRAANIESFSSYIYHDSCLAIVPVAVVSNETSHNCNVAFTNNVAVVSNETSHNHNVFTNNNKTDLLCTRN